MGVYGAFRDRQDNDAVLLAAERECQELLARADAQLKTDAADNSTEPLWDEIGKQAETVHNTPPSTLIGAAVKLRMALHPELGIEEDESSENVTALRQILALIEREIGHAGLRFCPPPRKLPCRNLAAPLGKGRPKGKLEPKRTPK